MVRLLLSLLWLSILSAEAKAETCIDADTLPAGIASRTLLFPFFLKSPETNWGFGLAGAFFFHLMNNKPDDRTSDVGLVGLYTLRKQTILAMNSTVYFRGEDRILRTVFTYTYYPDRFWGLGNRTENSDREDYSYQQCYTNPQFLFRIHQKAYIGINTDYQKVYDVRYTEGGAFDRQSVTGRNGSKVIGAGLLLTWDKRNSTYSPQNGSFAEWSSTYYPKTFGSDFGFAVHMVDLRGFARISRTTVLASQSVFRISTGDVPMRNLSLIGGSELMRGYWKGRFADRDMLAFQTEIRQFLFWRLGFTGFGGIAQVANNIHQFTVDSFHWSYGAGLRLMLQKKEKLNLRIDYGFGEHSSGLYVLLKEAF